MRTLCFAAFLAVVLVQYAVSQATQPALTQQPAAVQAPEKGQPQPEPSTSSQQNSQMTKDHRPASRVPNQFKFNIVPKTPPADKKLPTGTLDRGFRAFAPGLLPPFQSRRAIPIKDPDGLLAGDQQRKFDQGIYAQSQSTPGTGSFCSSIVSYNFSRPAPGEMPKLESVTTCTPSTAVVPRRAQGHEAQPVRPQLQRTGFIPR